jgi:hypothetical protein
MAKRSGPEMRDDETGYARQGGKGAEGTRGRGDCRHRLCRLTHSSAPRHGRRDAQRSTARWSDGASPMLRGDSATIMRMARASGAMGMGKGKRLWEAGRGGTTAGPRASRLGFASSRWEDASHAHHLLSLGTQLSSARARYGVWPLQSRAWDVLPQVGHARNSCVTTPASAKKFPIPSLFFAHDGTERRIVRPQDPVNSKQVIAGRKEITPSKMSCSSMPCSASSF